ncbi:hypothetical protein D3C87_2052270 [compost metagenome]
MLIAYQAERKAFSARIVDRAKARGEVPEATDSALLVDLVVSYAWHQLLLDQLEEAMAHAPAVVDVILGGVSGYRG